MRIPSKKAGKYLFLLYIFLVLSLPDGIKNVVSLYQMTTRGLPILYTFNYYFTVLELPIIIAGLYVYRSSSIIRFGKVILIVAAINIAFIIMGQEMNIVSIRSYEMFLLLLTGFSAASVVLWVADDFYELEKILDVFIIFQFILQLISMVSGASGAGGRFAAIGMGSGATASIAAAYLIWTLFSRTSKTPLLPIVISIVSIVLSGSRTNLLAFLFIVVVFSSRIIRRQYQSGNRKKVQIVLLFGIPILIAIVYFGIVNGTFNSLNRVTNLFQGGFVTNVRGDTSFLGRVRSIEGSFSILNKHPFGIPFSIYAIEYYSAYTFSMEYPHSTLLSYMLLWSPFVALGCFAFLVLLLIKCWKRKMDARIFLIYYLIMVVFYGSPILYAKTYALDLIIFSFIARSVEEYDRKAYEKEE